MAEFLAKDIRNIALIGHSGEGKTTLAEALLFTAKAIDRQGRTDDGNTTMDFDPEEIAKRISISLATGNCVYKDIKINIIDVPGYFDFEGEMVEALSVADSAIIVTGSSGNCSVGTEKALDYCMEHNIPATLFINGLDKDNCNYWGTVDAIAEKYPNKIAPVFIPYMLEGKLAGYVNVLLGEYYAVGTHGKSGQPFPEEIKARYDEARAKVIEAAAENDDDLMMKFFDGEELTREEILFGMNKGLKAGKCIPALAGSALTDKGIHNLLQHITDTLPSPADDKVEAKDSEGNAMEIDCVDKAPVVLQVFKTIADPFVGKLSLFKVVSGTLKSGLSLHNTSKECDEKISSIYFLRGKKQEPTDCVHAGDIGALSKLSNTSTGDTLCEGKVVMLPEIKMPRPVLSMAVYAAKKGDEDKIFAGLSKLKDEDIAFTVTKDPETKEMLLSGVGEAQLDVLCRKLKNKYSCEAVLKEPRIAYRETIKKSIEAEGKHKKQSGGAGQYGHCKVRFEPGAADGQFEFVDAVVGGAVPKQYIPAVEKGLRESIERGVLAGYPMVNLKCTLFDGSYHPVDSKEIAFKIAASMAYKDGCAKASPTILEPVYELRIVVPDNFLGDVMGDMNKRRGRILGTEMIGNKQIVQAEAPLSEITKYATDLRSLTQSRGSFSLKFVRYEEVPPIEIPKIIEDAKKLAEEAE